MKNKKTLKKARQKKNAVVSPLQSKHSLAGCPYQPVTYPLHQVKLLRRGDNGN